MCRRTFRPPGSEALPTARDETGEPRRREAAPAAPASTVGGTTSEAERRVAERRVLDEQVEEERRQAERRAADRAALERRRHVVNRVTQGVDYLFYLLYGLLGIRFVLALLGAAETAGFVQFINGITQPFYAPFSGIVARPSVNGGFIDFPLIIAVLAYALLHLAVRGLLRFVAGERR
jgi:YggT family protein